MGKRERRHRLGDIALLGHRGDHLGRAFGGGAGIAVGRELRRRLHQAGEHRGLLQRDLPRAVAEIFLRGGLDPVGAGAEIDAVQVEFEDLILGIFVLEPEREDRFLNLARQRALLRQKQVLGELLGDRRAALDPAAMEDVAKSGARDPRRDRCPSANRTGDPRWRRRPSAGRPACPADGSPVRRCRRDWPARCRRRPEWRYWAAVWGPRADRSAAIAPHNRRSGRTHRWRPRSPGRRTNRPGRRTTNGAFSWNCAQSCARSRPDRCGVLIGLSSGSRVPVAGSRLAGAPRPTRHRRPLFTRRPVGRTVRRPELRFDPLSPCRSAPRAIFGIGAQFGHFRASAQCRFASSAAVHRRACVVFAAVPHLP